MNTHLRILMVACALLLSPYTIGQLYSYSFSGTVKDSAAFVQTVQDIEWVEKCRLMLKPEKPGGVIIFRLNEYQVTYDEKGQLKNPNPLVNIKKSIQEQGLRPQELTRLKD